jgi:uncharacterized protein YlxW (UPF0749 family)
MRATNHQCEWWHASRENSREASDARAEAAELRTALENERDEKERAQDYAQDLKEQLAHWRARALAAEAECDSCGLS